MEEWIVECDKHGKVIGTFDNQTDADDFAQEHEDNNEGHTCDVSKVN